MTPSWINEVIKKTEEKIISTACRVGDELIFSTYDDGKYVEHNSKDLGWWTNGFWPAFCGLYTGKQRMKIYVPLPKVQAKSLTVCSTAMTG